MDFSRYRAISFDCYGTLIDWETGILTTLRPWLTRAGCTLDDDLVLEAYGRAESSVEAASPTLLYPDVLRCVVDRMAVELGIEALDSDRETLARSVRDWPAFDDSPAALSDLASRYQLAILSNVDHASFAGSNARLGIAFDLIVTAEDVGSYKPALANFNALFVALEARGIERREHLHVAQSLHHDIEPARALGLDCVWIDRRSNPHSYGATVGPVDKPQPDATFTSLGAFAAATRSE